MSEIIYRRMTIQDVAGVHAIEAATFPMPWTEADFIKEMTTNHCARYIVAQRDGLIIGFAGAWLILDEGHITNIAVTASERGNGIGRRLLQALMQYAANLGVQYMTLQVRESNAVARSLYESNSFIKLGIRKKYYEDNGENALLMVCDHMPEAEADFSEEETVTE